MARLATIKQPWTGIATSFFKAELDGPKLLAAWLFESNHTFQQDLDHTPQVDLSKASLTWNSAGLIFALCCLVSSILLLYAHAGSGPARLSRMRDMCKMRLLNVLRFVSCKRWRQATGGGLEEALLVGERPEGDTRAISNFSRLCLVNREVAQEELGRSWAGQDGWRDAPYTEDGEYRVEFLLFGLLHGLLGFVRELLLRESFPHTWGILQSQVAKQRGLELFHQYLIDRHWAVNGDHTALDKPFLTFDFCMSLSSVLQAVLWILVLASLLSEFQRQKRISQVCSFAAGAVAVVSGLTVLAPNYARLTNFPQYFEGCGQQFERLMEYVVSGVFGIMFAVPLGLQVFGILVAIPISAVRGLWFIMIRPKMRSNRILHAAMWLVAFLIPFVTIFPLLFFNQLTENPESQYIIFAFWVFPSMTIIAAGAYRSETWFYFGWLTVYCGLVGYFLYYQSQIMKIDVQRAVRHLDLPWLWSVMHSDFCLTSVIITDLVCLVLGDQEGNEESEESYDTEDEDEEQHPEQEMSKKCVVVPQMAFSVSDHIRSLPGFEKESVEQGLTMVSFDSKTSAEAAAREMNGQLLPLNSLFRPHSKTDLH